jgi:hypothetical protein
MISNILSNIICTEFEKSIGKFNKDTAMDLKIALYPYHGTPNDEICEDGYRNLYIRIFAPNNYVAVLIKEDWTVINSNDIDHENDCLKKGKKYTEGNTGWIDSTPSVLQQESW